MSTLKVDTIKSDTTPTVTISDGLSVSGVTTSTGDVSIADKIIHTGDTNTAIRFPDADTITAETGGSERFRITSAGKVGINSDSPGHVLDVAGNIRSYQTTPSLYLQTTANTAESAVIRFGDAGSFQRGSIQYDFAGDSHLRFKMGGAGNNLERMTIVGSTGRVGIGTVTPDTLLHLGAGSGSAQVKMQRTDAASDTNDYGRIYWESYSGTLTGQISVARQSAENDGYMLFKTAASGSLGERLRITKDGAIGIAGANYGTSGQVLTSQGSGSAVQWASVSGGPTHYTKFTNEPAQSGNVTLSNWDVFSPGLSPTINTAVSHSSGIFSFPVTGIWECYANVLWSFDGGATEQRLEIHGTTDNGTNWDILTRQYQCWVNTSTTKYQSLPTPHLLLDITNITNCKVKFKVAGGPAGAQTAGDDNEWYTGCHFIRWADT